ncbi:chromate resistance protein ChrB domain-containing protein [Marinomonas posidonica]|uniref:Chromate resistance exported protein n=1 Tax=Marinomonas posidonica (strain CECT 7376 / NCIMB 14433 / IVIA-Po-181) TaxID=491952 RepID=F6CZ99_MARPP|nr:sulfurtransferase/chromate resistance protein [Marinomonas posidonica]AEF54636.1 Chromate resistance exported protein [Marinomonas posidonica IVIA-Po-181]
MASPTEITVSQLSRLIGTPNAPVIIDVRINEDFDLDPQIIPTAIRCPHLKVAELAPKLNAQRVVIYCQQGKKISQGSLAILRSMGVAAESLEGGHFGWRDAGQTLIPYDKLPQKNLNQQTVWVTKQRPKIDRIACPWLIRRFIDPQAQFLFVAASEVLGVAEKFNATPFDVEDVFWSHRSELCTFDVMVEEFEIKTPAILHLAKVIRGADTNRHDLAPECAGLLAASLGLSRMYRDDNEQLDAGMLLYDAFYRWARDASNEGHDWLTNNKKG